MNSIFSNYAGSIPFLLFSPFKNLISNYVRLKVNLEDKLEFYSNKLESLETDFALGSLPDPLRKKYKNLFFDKLDEMQTQSILNLILFQESDPLNILISKFKVELETANREFYQALDERLALGGLSPRPSETELWAAFDQLSFSKFLKDLSFLVRLNSFELKKKAEKKKADFILKKREKEKASEEPLILTENILIDKLKKVFVSIPPKKPQPQQGKKKKHVVKDKRGSDKPKGQPAAKSRATGGKKRNAEQNQDGGSGRSRRS